MSREILAVIAARCGVRAKEVRAVASGVANFVYSVGDELVLRIPRSEAFVADLCKEAVVIPVARRFGVRTPEVVAFDGGCSEVGVPFMVLRRVVGVDLASPELAGSSLGGTEQVFQQVGRELAKLHRVTSGAVAERAEIPLQGDAGDPRSLVEGLRADGMIDTEATRWLGGWFDRLSARGVVGEQLEQQRLVLVHGDIAPQNLLVSPNGAELRGIVDWGDAMWAEPAVEFAKMPLVSVPAMLDGYREVGGDEQDFGLAELEARVLWYHLMWALARLKDPAPMPGQRHWTAPPASRLLGILRFFASGPPAPWADLA